MAEPGRCRIVEDVETGVWREEVVMVMGVGVVGYEALVGFRAGIRGSTRASEQHTHTTPQKREYTYRHVYMWSTVCSF